MYRALVVLAALLLPLSAHGQPPAPVGGDMSNTTVTAAGTSVATTLAARAGIVLNARTDSTADSSGVADSYAAIQGLINTIAAAGTRGGTLFIPAGTYKLSQPLVCPNVVAGSSKLTIEGAGAAATILKPFASTPALLSISTAYCDVRGITFNQDDASPLAQRAILINKPTTNSPIHLDDLNFNKGACSTCNFATADIEVQKGDQIFIRRSHHVGANNGTAIWFSQVNGTSFDGSIDDTLVLGENGIDFGCSGTFHAEGMQVSNAHIYPSMGGTFGIRQRCGVALTLINNVLGQNNLGSGLIIDATNYPIGFTSVVAGWEDGSGQSPGSVNGIRILSSVHGVTISGGNRPLGLHGYGIYVDGGTLLLNTNGATAAGSAVLNFASSSGIASTGNSVTPCGVTWLVADVTTPTAIPAATSISTCSPTTITMSANAKGPGVGDGDQIKLWQQANQISISGAQMGIGSGNGPNVAGDLYINNAPSISVIGNVFGSLTNIIEAGTTESMTFGNSFRLGGALTRNAASQWAMNSNSDADGLQLAGFGTAPTVGALITSAGGALTYGEQGISVAGSTAATNGTAQLSSMGSGLVELVTGGFLRLSAGNVPNGSIDYEVPLVNGNYIAQNFNGTPEFLFLNGITGVLNNAGGSVAGAVTVTMPTTDFSRDGMHLIVVCGLGMTNVTWAANADETMVDGGSTTCPAGSSAQFFYRAATATWYKL